MAAAATLTVDFCGDVRVLKAGTELTFGRLSELEIDDNPYLHRKLGSLAYEGEHWWLTNVGRTIVLSLIDADSRNRFTVPPGGTAAVTFRRGVVRFEAGPTTYEIDLGVNTPRRAPVTERLEMQAILADVRATASVADLAVLDTEWPVLVALAEPMLKNPTAERVEVPTNRAAAQRLGLRMPQFNRSLDRLCAKLTEVGVDGLVTEDESSLAYDRRVRLVRWALDHQLVDAGDLELLEG
jgi:hypothetical protein